MDIKITYSTLCLSIPCISHIAQKLPRLYPIPFLPFSGIIIQMSIIHISASPCPYSNAPSPHLQPTTPLYRPVTDTDHRIRASRQLISHNIASFMLSFALTFFLCFLTVLHVASPLHPSILKHHLRRIPVGRSGNRKIHQIPHYCLISIFQLPVICRSCRQQKTVAVPHILHLGQVIIMLNHQGGKLVKVQTVPITNPITQLHCPEFAALPGIRPKLVIIRIHNQIIGDRILEYS